MRTLGHGNPTRRWFEFKDIGNAYEEKERRHSHQDVWSTDDQQEWNDECADLDDEIDNFYEDYQQRVRQPFLQDLFLQHALIGLNEHAKEKIGKFVSEEKSRRLQVWMT